MYCGRRILPDVVAGAGQLVWRRHRSSSPPSRHAVRATCMDLLPLIEMYCRWELQEECGNLRALMDRFDSEASLQTTELGCSLLLMLRDNDDGLQFRAPRQESSPPLNPFAAIRGRLAAVDRAFQGLHAQVLPSVDIGLGVSTVLSVYLSPALADILRSSGRPITCNPNFVSGTACRPFAATSICAPPPVGVCNSLCVCLHPVMHMLPFQLPASRHQFSRSILLSGVVVVSRRSTCMHTL